MYSALGVRGNRLSCMLNLWTRHIKALSRGNQIHSLIDLMVSINKLISRGLVLICKVREHGFIFI